VSADELENGADKVPLDAEVDATRKKGRKIGATSNSSRRIAQGFVARQSSTHSKDF
jgi:hypothetical protein